MDFQWVKTFFKIILFFWDVILHETLCIVVWSIICRMIWMQLLVLVYFFLYFYVLYTIDYWHWSLSLLNQVSWFATLRIVRLSGKSQIYFLSFLFFFLLPVFIYIWTKKCTWLFTKSSVLWLLFYDIPQW